jgi:LmbE family N-acetylglucosaminyl deacetylase
VTDGDAAFPHDDLAAVRRAELTSALRCLSTGATIGGDRLGIPDGHVAAHVEELATHLRGMIRPDDLVVCPLDDDGHPDHDATAWAAMSAALGCQAAVRCYPLWAWHCHDPEHSPIARGTRLHLTPAARRAKRAAISCYASQLGGPDPVVPARMLARLDREFEVYVTPEGSR